MIDLKQYTNISAGDGNLVIRRSITVDDDLNTYINILRARMLENAGVERDFTTVINTLAYLGALRFSKPEDLTDEENQTINKFFHGSPDLQVEGAKDKYVDEWLKYELPKITSAKSRKTKRSAKRKKVKAEELVE